MATSYTPNKAIGEPALSDTGWGTTVNTSLSQIDTAFGGSTSLNVTALSGNQTLSSAQYSPLTLTISGVLTANVNYVVPSAVGGQWMVYNGATGAFVLSISSAAGGSAVTIPPGALINVSCDGTASGMRTTQSVSSVAFSTSLSGLTVSGSPITSSGTIALSGILGTTSGGTGLASFTSGGAIYASGTTTLTSGTLPVASGGTGLVSYTSGGAIYATGTTTLTSGTLPVASGGTGVTTSTGTGNVVLSSGPTITLGNATGLPLATGVTGTLPIANGGTGLTTTPSNGQIDIGNGTGFTRATLTAGNGITITNGAGSITVTSAGVSSQAFTSTGTFTIPVGVTAVKVSIVGAGGGGSTAFSGCSADGGSGGAGGSAITYLASLTPGNTIAVTVGTGGATGILASNGGSSSIASGTQTITTVTASGGTGGSSVVSGSGQGSGGSVTAGSPTISITGVSGSLYPVSPLFGGLSNGSGGRGNTVGTATAGRSGLVLFEW